MCESCYQYLLLPLAIVSECAVKLTVYLCRAAEGLTKETRFHFITYSCHFHFGQNSLHLLMYIVLGQFCLHVTIAAMLIVNFSGPLFVA